MMLCRSVTDLEGAQLPIYSLRQNAVLNLSFAKSVFLRVGGEHYYNDAVQGDRSMFFLDASLSWRMKRHGDLQLGILQRHHHVRLHLPPQAADGAAEDPLHAMMWLDRYVLR